MRTAIILAALALAFAATPTALADDLWPDELPVDGPDPSGCRPYCDLSFVPIPIGPPGCKPNCEETP